MASTVINLPGIPAGLTLTTDVCNPTTLAVLETVTLTEASGVYSGVVTGAIAGQKLFVIKASGARIGREIRTIADTVGPFTILSELEDLADDGRGEYPVTITIDDGTDPIEGASVRVTATGVAASGTTDADGIALFALNNGTYTVTITKPGYDSEVESLTVSGVSSDTYSLDAISVTPPASALVSTGVGLTYDELGQIEPAVPMSVELVSGPGTAGYALDTKQRSTVSDEYGVFEFTGLIRGATYNLWRGAATGTDEAEGFTVRAAASTGGTQFVVPNSDTFTLPEVIGYDEAVIP